MCLGGERQRRQGSGDRAAGLGLCWAMEHSPSVLVTTGRAPLLSLGEDIFEFGGEVRAV